MTFLDQPFMVSAAFPRELDGAPILEVQGTEAFSVHVRNPKGPVSMKLIEQVFGMQQTNLTWGTLRRCAAA